MNLNVYFKSVLEQDTAAVVLCNLEHEIIYMNPAAKARYAKHSGGNLVGKSLLNCHNPKSNEKIEKVVELLFVVIYSPQSVFKFFSIREKKKLTIFSSCLLPRTHIERVMIFRAVVTVRSANGLYLTAPVEKTS